jgi:hypothetical protein
MEKWEYLVVEFSQVEKKGMGIAVMADDIYRAHYENGVLLQDWQEGPTFRRYLTDAGENGWEFAGNGPPKHGGVTCVFKRSKD